MIHQLTEQGWVTGMLAGLGVGVPLLLGWSFWRSGMPVGKAGAVVLGWWLLGCWALWASLTDWPAKLGPAGAAVVPAVWLGVAGVFWMGRSWFLGCLPSSRFLAGFQILRFVGALFLFEYAAGRIPGAFAIPAGVGDILVGLLALSVFVVQQKKGSVSPRGLLWITVAGLLDFAVALFFGLATSRALEGFLYDPEAGRVLAYPSGIIPLYLVPLAIFAHLLAIARIREDLGVSRVVTGRGVPAACRMATAGVLSVVLMSGCASVSVREVRVDQTPKTPAKILVKPFEFSEGSLRVDRKGQDLEKFQTEFQTRFSESLAERLNKFVAPAEVVNDLPLRPGAGTWVVDGEFRRINQGSRLLRALLGFGLGGTKLETDTRVALLSRGGKTSPVLSISTTGGSNAEPGGLVGPIFTIPLRIALQASSGLDRDAKRTARMVSAAIQDELQKAGQPVAGPDIRTKPLGGLAPAKKKD